MVHTQRKEPRLTHAPPFKNLVHGVDRVDVRRARGGEGGEADTEASPGGVCSVVPRPPWYVVRYC